MTGKALMVAAGILFTGGVAVVCACSCRPAASAKDALAQADAVFAGTVKSIEAVKEPSGGREEAFSDRKVTLQTVESWKGTNAATLVAYTARFSSACGYGFAQGEKYLVYAMQRGGQAATELTVSLCSRTRKYAQATDDLRDLGAGEKPKAK